MKLVSTLQGKKLGTPIFVKVGEVQLDILPFTFGFFEALMEREIECETEFDGYIKSCGTWAARIIHQKSGIIITEKDLDTFEDTLFSYIVGHLIKCSGKLGEA